MPELMLDTTINDLVDSVYEDYDITEEWTSTMHRRATDKVKRAAKKLASEGQTVKAAVEGAIQDDCKDNEPKYHWLSGRLTEAVARQNVDPSITEAVAKRAHHERIDNERAHISFMALRALHAMDEHDSYAQVVVLFYMNARAEFDAQTKKRTRGVVDVAGDKALAYAHTQFDDLSDEEISSLKSSIGLGKKVLLDIVRENRTK